MIKLFRAMWTCFTTRQKAVSGTAAAFILVMAAVGVYHTLYIWRWLLLALLFLLAVGVALWCVSDNKREEHRSRTCDFVHSFVKENTNLPVPVKPPSDAEELRETSYATMHGLVTTVTVNLLRRTVQEIPDLDQRLALLRKWLKSYAADYGKKHNLPGYSAQYPHFCPRPIKPFDDHIEAPFVIVEPGPLGWLAVRHIKKLPEPEIQADTTNYFDDDFS